jgi:hypothetical protein
MAEKKERSYWNQIQFKNKDISDEEFLECFNLVSETKDSKGKPVAMRFLWMANGFDMILMDARQRIRSRKRQEEERKQAEQKAQQEAAIEQQVSPEEAEQAKNMIRALLGSGPLKSFGPPQKTESEQERRAFLLAQARKIEQIEKFGRL